MKLLLDSCIWPGAKVEFAAAGHEVEWVGDWMVDPGDEQVLAHAAQNDQIANGSIVTVEPGRTRVRPPDEPEQ